MCVYVCVCVYTYICVCVCVYIVYLSFSGGASGPAIAADVRDTSLIPGLGRSPGGGHGNPLQYSCLENRINTGA